MTRNIAWLMLARRRKEGREMYWIMNFAPMAGELIALIVVVMLARRSFARHSVVGIVATITAAIMVIAAIATIHFGVVGLAIGLLVPTIWALSLYGMIAVILMLAENDFVFTNIREGTAKVIMAGNGFHRCILQFRGHHLSSVWDIEAYPAGTPESLWQWLKGVCGISGIHFIGIPGVHYIHHYNFRWSSTRQDTDARVREIIRHEQEIDYIIAQYDGYLVAVENAEDKNGVPLIGLAVVILRVTNPYKALFVAQEWMELTVEQIVPRMRQFIAGLEWETINRQSTYDLTNLLEDAEPRLNLKAILLERYGVDIDSLQLLNIDPTESMEETIRTAATAEYVGRGNAKKRVAEAKGESEAISTLADGKAEAIRKESAAQKDRVNMLKATGAEGLVVVELDTMRDVAQGQGNTIWQFPDGVKRLIEQARQRRQP